MPSARSGGCPARRPKGEGSIGPRTLRGVLQTVRLGFLIVLVALMMPTIIRLDPEHFGTVLRVVRLGFLILLVALMIDVIR
jgi:hypothetical protein